MSRILYVVFCMGKNGKHFISSQLSVLSNPLSSKDQDKLNIINHQTHEISLLFYTFGWQSLISTNNDCGLPSFNFRDIWLIKVDIKRI